MRVYVGCEGDSERSYIRWLQSRLDEAGQSVHLDSFIGGGGDPLAVVENCVAECLRRQRLYGPYRVRAIFLDSDKIGENQGRDALIPGKLRKGKIDTVFQVHDHEALLLRHFAGCQTKRPPKRLSLPALKKVWPDYEKPADAQALSQQLDRAALERAVVVEQELRTFLAALGFTVQPAKRRRNK